MFYRLAYTQGIQIVVNTRTTTFARASHAIACPTQIPSHAPIVETLTPTTKVDQLLDFTATLLVRDSISPLVLIKRD